MINSLWTASSGMYAQELNINSISNNLANVATNGFKKVRVDFEDLIYQNLRGSGTPVNTDTVVPVGLEVGHGVRPIATNRIFSQGDLKETGAKFDFAIEGEGFFEVMLPNGQLGYTRDGSLKIDAEGTLVTSNGFRLQPEIVIPPEAVDLHVGMDGTVSVVIDGIAEELGAQIQLVRFPNASGLKSLGRNLFQPTEASGEAVGPGNPGDDGLGTILHRFLETSNVKAVEEMVNMIVAQRAYELNSKSIQTSDAMLQVVNSLKR